MRTLFLLLSLVTTGADAATNHQDYVKRDPLSPNDVSNTWSAIEAPITNSPPSFLFSQTFDNENGGFLHAFSGDTAGFNYLQPFAQLNYMFFNHIQEHFRARLAIVQEKGAPSYHVEAAGNYSISRWDGKDFQRTLVLPRNPYNTDAGRCDGFMQKDSYGGSLARLTYRDAAFSPSQELVAVTENCLVENMGQGPLRSVERQNLVLLNRHDGTRVGDFTNAGSFVWLNDSTILARHAYDATFPSKDRFGIYLLDVALHARKLVHEARGNEWFFKPKSLADFYVLAGTEVLEYDANGGLVKTHAIPGIPCESYDLASLEGSDDGAFLALGNLTCAGEKAGANILVSLKTEKAVWTSSSEHQRAVSFLPVQQAWLLEDTTFEHNFNPNEPVFTTRLLDAASLEIGLFPMQCERPEERSSSIEEILPTPSGQFVIKYSCYMPGYLEMSQWLGGFTIPGRR